MEFSKLELKILQILWSSDLPLSNKEISEKLDLKYLSSFITSYCLDGLLAKKAVRQSGVFQNYSLRNSAKTATYTPIISFVDYWSPFLRTISPHNLFLLNKWIFSSGKLTDQQIDELILSKQNITRQK